MTFAIFTVAASRLAYGEYDHLTGRYVGIGDIRASYSADVIATEGRIRAPFVHEGVLYVAVGGTNTETKAVALAHPRQFPRAMMTYHEKSRAGAAGSDPFGFYDGIRVKCGAVAYVLCGPGVIFKGDKALNRVASEQLPLF